MEYDARQAGAVTEGINPDAGDAIRNRDARQAGAATEGLIPDTGDRIAINGIWNNKFAGSDSITIGDGDFSVSRGVCQYPLHGEAIPSLASLTKRA